MEKTFKNIKRVWFVIRSFLALVVVVGAFSIAETKFETIVIAGLIIIILSLETYARTWGMIYMEEKTPNREDKEAFEKHASEKVSLEKKIFANTMFSYLIYLIAIFNLMVVILD